MPDAYRTKLERRIHHRDISGIALLDSYQKLESLEGMKNLMKE